MKDKCTKCGRNDDQWDRPKPGDEDEIINIHFEGTWYGVDICRECLTKEILNPDKDSVINQQLQEEFTRRLINKVF